MRRISILLGVLLVLAILGGCDLLGGLFGSKVELSLSCPGEAVDGIGTDASWRVSLDDGELVSTNSAYGGSVTFDAVSRGSHTLHFTPPSGCYDQEVAYYDFEVTGDDELTLSTTQLTLLADYSVRAAAKADGE